MTNKPERKKINGPTINLFAAKNEEEIDDYYVVEVLDEKGNKIAYDESFSWAEALSIALEKASSVYKSIEEAQCLSERIAEKLEDAGPEVAKDRQQVEDLVTPLIVETYDPTEGALRGSPDSLVSKSKLNREPTPDDKQ